VEIFCNTEPVSPKSLPVVLLTHKILITQIIDNSLEAHFLVPVPVLAAVVPRVLPPKSVWLIRLGDLVFIFVRPGVFLHVRF
jgi:hypothetical protein